MFDPISIRVARRNLRQRLEALRPHLDDLLTNSYGIHRTSSEAVFLNGGHWNALARIETPERPLVVRVCDAGTTAADLDFELAVSRRAAFVTPASVSPLATTGGRYRVETEFGFVLLYPFVEHDQSPFDEKEAEVAGRLLARLHASAARDPLPARIGRSPIQELDWRTNSLWNWRDIERFMSGERGIRRQAFSVFGADVPEAADRLTRCKTALARELAAVERFCPEVCSRYPSAAWVHGDWSPDNLLRRSGLVVGIVDWEQAQIQVPAFDFAVAVAYCCHDPNDCDNHRMKDAFVAGYQSEGGFRVGTYDLACLIRCARLYDVLYGLGDALRGAVWYPEYLLHTLQHAPRDGR